MQAIKQGRNLEHLSGEMLLLKMILGNPQTQQAVDHELDRRAHHGRVRRAASEKPKHAA